MVITHNLCSVFKQLQYYYSTIPIIRRTNLAKNVDNCVGEGWEVGSGKWEVGSALGVVSPLLLMGHGLNGSNGLNGFFLFYRTMYVYTYLR